MDLSIYQLTQIIRRVVARAWVVEMESANVRIEFSRFLGLRVCVTHLSKVIMDDHPQPIKYVASPGFPSVGDPTNGWIWTGQNGLFISLGEVTNFLLLRMLGKSSGFCLVYE